MHAEKKPSLPHWATWITVTVVFAASFLLVARPGDAAPDVDDAGTATATAPPEPVVAPTLQDHPEWAMPYALSLGDFGGATAPPSRAPAAVTARAPAPPKVPTWLTGQSDVSPRAVIETWQAYARTQGPSLDAMRELVAYAQQHPARAMDANGVSRDAWLQAAATADRHVLAQMVAAGYLDGAMATLFATTDAAHTSDAVRDMDLASRCVGSSCASWRARFAQAYLEERSQRQDPTVRCNPGVVLTASTVPPWLVADDDPSTHDVARAMDDYLARQRAVSCGTVRG